MENTFNLAQLLKDCPKGMELDSPIWDGVVLDHVDMKNSNYPIYIKKKGGLKENLTENGCFDYDIGAKCVIFPKGKTTWEGFVPPQQFKDGDVLVHTQNQRFVMSIYHKRSTDLIIMTHCILWDEDEGLSVGGNIYCYADQVRLANEKEKQKLFNAIEDAGYRWNFETKTLEQLVKPNFKIGDKILKNGDTTVATIKDIRDNDYIITFPDSFGNAYITDKLSFSNQNEWELIPNKFEITTLKPFESRVLVRSANNDIWRPAIYGFTDSNRYYVVGGVFWEKCIPYEGNEHLLGTIDNCNEYFKTWED